MSDDKNVIPCDYNPAPHENAHLICGKPSTTFCVMNDLGGVICSGCKFHPLTPFIKDMSDTSISAEEYICMKVLEHGH